MAKENTVAPRTEQNTVCFTGHRYISRSEVPIIRQRLQRAIRECCRKGYRWFICGGALGFDTLAALAVLQAKKEFPDIGLYMALPCADQSARWGENDRKQYRKIRDLADDEIVLAPHYYSGCMHMRNQFMVQHASLCICYLSRFSGGTGYTVRYALACQREVINLCFPESGLQVRVREPSWSCTFTFPSVSESALIVRSIPIPAVVVKKWSSIYLRSCGKRRFKGNI